MVAASSVVLAGGKSRRMGTDKAFLEVGGATIVQRVLAALETLSDDTIIVTNSPEEYAGLPARLGGDFYPNKGALGGIHAGLLAARYDYIVAVACDMPFLNPRLLRHLADLVENYDVVVPDLGGGHLETTHAVYSKGCLEPIERLILEDRLRIVELPVPLIYLEEERSFGGSLDDMTTRLNHYREVLDRSIAALESFSCCRGDVCHEGLR